MEDTSAPEITFSPIKAKRLDEKASLQVGYISSVRGGI